MRGCAEMSDGVREVWKVRRDNQDSLFIKHFSRRTCFRVGKGRLVAGRSCSMDVAQGGGRVLSVLMSLLYSVP